MSNKFSLEEISKRITKDSEGVSDYSKVYIDEMDWLVEQARWARTYYEDSVEMMKEKEDLKSVIDSVLRYCEREAERSNKEKFNEERHKVDRIFFNGKERAFEEIHDYISKLVKG